MQRVPEHLQPLVRALANNARALILYHAEHPMTAPNTGKPWKLAGLYRTVIRYKAARL